MNIFTLVQNLMTSSTKVRFNEKYPSPLSPHSSGQQDCDAVRHPLELGFFPFSSLKLLIILISDNPKSSIDQHILRSECLSTLSLSICFRLWTIFNVRSNS